ncbi:MAG: hypothetical protein MK082_12510, partial [Phycisphaerales bacterium]|nr:hypothetical protein [Phycisphaerales bacterium]
MSKIHAAFAATATLSFAASLAHAEIYTDPVGDQASGVDVVPVHPFAAGFVGPSGVAPEDLP